MAIAYWEGLDMYDMTEEDKAQAVRQNAIYTATAFFAGQQPSAEEFIDFAKRVVDYVSNGQ